MTGETLYRRESGAVASQFHDPPSIEPYSSELVQTERAIVLGKKSGVDSIRIKAEELGLHGRGGPHPRAAGRGQGARHAQARDPDRRGVRRARRPGRRVDRAGLRRGGRRDRQPLRRASRPGRGRLGAHAARGARPRAERRGPARLRPLRPARLADRLDRPGRAARAGPRAGLLQGHRPRGARSPPRRPLPRGDRDDRAERPRRVARSSARTAPGRCSPRSPS